jgi:predicted NAD/FAD-dependent oxidoreductase
VLEMAEEEAVLVFDRSKGLGRLLVRVELDCDCDCGSADDEAGFGIAA